MLLHTRKILLCTGLLCFMSFVCVAQEATNPDVEGLRRTIKQLRSENEQLRARVAELEKRLEAPAIRDRLVQEEQRVENLLAQLVAIGEKESDLQRRLDETNEQLQPENIDQLQVMGSLRPEQVREAARRRLTNEQNRLRSQIDLVQQSRTRLQSSLSVTEMLVQNLRAKLQSALRP